MTVEEVAQAAARDVWEHASTVDDNARRIAKHFRGWLPPDQVERVREVLSVHVGPDCHPSEGRHGEWCLKRRAALALLPAPATREAE